MALWVLAALAAWAATGIYVVQPNERAVVWRCGRILAQPSLPGIHCGLPWGLDRVTRLKVYKQKRVGIGLKLDHRIWAKPPGCGGRNAWPAIGT